MAKKSQWAQVGKRKIELTNLEKVLFPEDHILKAEVIEYYLNIAPTLLNHVKGRALTLIRFPDGINGESFYQKNRPEWAPDWLEFVTLGKEVKDYIIATEPASLVWLANMAALELHQLHSRKPTFDCPDYMVFDLDPPEGYNFKDVISIALDLKSHVESFGYTPFVKTTGGKGVHICCPIEAKRDFSTVFDAAQLIAQPFVEARSKDTTLHIKKEARKGRVLVDIYRIRSGQSIVSPYSLRGRNGAPVSMPLHWEELTKVKSPSEFNIKTALAKVLSDGDAWEGINAYAVDLHTYRKETKSTKKLPVNKKHKSPEQLETYAKKRDFEKTPEPAAKVIDGSGNNFVVHRHHASHLHYDLRLEQDGVLKSWAVPKGLPPNPGVKRLAVQTEDHPMEYLTFDGKIPKGQYGAGEMWIYALGKYQITKEKKDGFYFRLNSKEINGEYRIHKTKEKEWLLERVDDPQIDYLHKFIEPMLSESADKPPHGEYVYEVKWDGIRAMIALENGQIKIVNRNERDITAQFPELLNGEKAFRATCGLFDAEIVCLDNTGKPEFKKVINRLMSSGEAYIQKLSKTNPVYCYVFDCLYLDGRPLVNEPMLKRREWLRDTIRSGDSPYRVSEFVEDGESLFEAAREHNLEGIMAKKAIGKYLPGKRSDLWVKVKVRNTRECVIIGYTQGKGDRGQTFGALQVAERDGDELHYRGKVGTGFDDATIKEILKALKTVKEIKKPVVVGKLFDEKVSVWLESKIVAEISYSKITTDKMFREPVFIRLRLDLSNLK